VGGGTGNRTPCKTSAHTQGLRPGAGPPGAAQYTASGQLRFSFQKQPHKASQGFRLWHRTTRKPTNEWWLGEFSHENSHLPRRGRSTLHLGGSSDSYILRSTSDPDLYMGIRREDFFQSLLSKRSDELLFSARALVTRMKEELLAGPEGATAGVPAGIDVNKPPKNFWDAMSREDRQQWAEAYDSEYQGFLEHGTLKLVRPESGAKVVGTTTRTEYKVTNGVFKKRKVRLCVMCNQQKEGVHFQLGDFYVPVMKAAEVRLFIAIAAKHRLNLFKSDTKQAFLNGDIGD
jgi:hypothetical protein